MKTIDSLPVIATTGHPQSRHGPHLAGITADSFGWPRGESWRERADGPSSTRWTPGRYGWSAHCRAMTESQLLESFVATNDPDAFRALIERHGPMVLSVCRNVLRARHDVEDAFQDTFLALARSAHTIKHSEYLGRWLRQVALHMALRERFKASQRRFHERNRTDYRTEYPTDPPDLFLIALLREEVSRLPVNCRLPVVLCYLEGKSCREAAAQLSCPVGTIKGQLWRARQTLRDRLSGRVTD
jgi:RNA polymerase sigma factor (sigma-70 family)